MHYYPDYFQKRLENLHNWPKEMPVHCNHAPHLNYVKAARPVQDSEMLRYLSGARLCVDEPSFRS